MHGPSPKHLQISNPPSRLEKGEVGNRIFAKRGLDCQQESVECLGSQKGPKRLGWVPKRPNYTTCLAQNLSREGAVRIGIGTSTRTSTHKYISIPVKTYPYISRRTHSNTHRLTHTDTYKYQNTSPHTSKLIYTRSYTNGAYHHTS